MIRLRKTFRTMVLLCFICLASLLPARAAQPVPADDLMVETLADQRVDIQNVIMALAYNLQGAKEQGIGAVMLDEDFGRLKDGTGLQYAEFRLVGATVTKDIHLLDDPRYRELSVTLEWADPGLRTAFVDVTANYYLGKDLIFLERAEAKPSYPDRGQVQLFYLAPKDLSSLAEMSALSYPRLAELVADHALTMADLGEIPPGKMTRLRVVALHRCRLLPDARLSFSIVGDDNESLAVATAVKGWNLNGWAVAAADGLFVLNSLPGFQLEVSLTSTGQPELQTVLVDRSTSIFSPPLPGEADAAP